MARFFDFLPLILLSIFGAVFAWVGYQVRNGSVSTALTSPLQRLTTASSQMYIYSQTLAQQGKQSMAKHNITVGKEGAKIGVKEVNNEDYSGKTQDYLVKAWNLSSWPEYRSRFWNKQAQGQGKAQR